MTEPHDKLGLVLDNAPVTGLAYLQFFFIGLPVCNVFKDNGHALAPVFKRRGHTFHPEMVRLFVQDDAEFGYRFIGFLSVPDRSRFRKLPKKGLSISRIFFPIRDSLCSLKKGEDRLVYLNNSLVRYQAR